MRIQERQQGLIFNQAIFNTLACTSPPDESSSLDSDRDWSSTESESGGDLTGGNRVNRERPFPMHRDSREPLIAERRRNKAVLKSPHSKRFATARRLQTARSIWSAAASTPLSEPAADGSNLERPENLSTRERCEPG